MGTAYRRFIASGTVFRIIFITISPLALFLFFIYFSFFPLCLHSKRSFGFGGIWSYYSSPGNTLQRSFTQSLYRLWTFLSSTTTPHGWTRGRVFGCIYNWAGIRYRRLVFFWPFSFRHLWFSRKRRTRSNARRSALVRDRNFSADSSLISPGLSFSFFSPLFSLSVRFREASWKIPYKRGRHTTDTLTSLRSLACFPIHDDIILMTTSSTTR